MGTTVCNVCWQHMTRFEKALHKLGAVEGGYVDHPRDPGGATNHGISLRFARRVASQLRYWRLMLDADDDTDVDVEDIRLLHADLARDLYKKFFWDKYRCEELPEGIGAAFFMIVVNLPPRSAIKVLQHAIVRAGVRLSPYGVDGVLGDVTVNAARACNQGDLAQRLVSELCMYYVERVEADPSKRVFLNGWFYRAASMFIP